MPGTNTQPGRFVEVDIWIVIEICFILYSIYNVYQSQSTTNYVVLGLAVLILFADSLIRRAMKKNPKLQY